MTCFSDLRNHSSMASMLNYSENDFPTLESSAVRGKPRKWNHKSLARTANLNGNSSIYVDCQPHQRSISKENCTLKGDRNSESKQSNENRTQSRKPRPTESVTIGDFLVKPDKPFPKGRRIRSAANSKGNLVLGGNPLDTDCPIRYKGFMNVPRKSKNLSKIKTAVHKGREEMKKIKEYSTQVSVEKNAVLLRSKIPEEYIWKSVVYGKDKDLKSIMNYNRCEAVKQTSSDDLDQISIANDNEEMQHESTELPNSPNDEESCYRISLQKLLQHSGIPPFKILLHHHNFKSYCDNCITEELNRITSSLISQIVRYQRNKYQANPTKAIANKRFVVGFKQITKYLKMNKIKVFVIVPDMEDSLSDTVEELKLLANAYSIPYLFALSRRKLGFLTQKKVGVCCFGILDHSGAEAKFDKIIASVNKAKLYYKDKCSKAEEFYESYFKGLSEIDLSVTENLNELIQKFNTNFSLQEKTKSNDDSSTI